MMDYCRQPSNVIDKVPRITLAALCSPIWNFELGVYFVSAYFCWKLRATEFMQ